MESELNRLNDVLNRVQAPSYLIANPFSKLGNEDLNGTLSPSIFYRYFYTLSNEYYERLADILTVAENPNMNTVFITGFRGCGKTTFARFLSSVLLGEYSLTYEPDHTDPTTSQVSPSDTTEQGGPSLLYQRLAQRFSLEQEISGVDIIEANRRIISQIDKQLKGKAVYINFEVGTNSIDIQ